MKKAVLSVICLQLFFSVAASASGEEQLHGCPDTGRILDIEEIERLPFEGAGAKYEFKVPTGAEAITINEEKRQLRVAEEITTIIKAVSEQVKAQAPDELCTTYTQKYKRSTIEVTVIDKDENELALRKLVAGPEEHWYLSADMPISNIKQLKYDSAASSVVEKEKPASFYLGVNWQVGDVFSEYTGSEFYKQFSVKFMLKASGKPSESYGVGLGYSFEAVDFFAARLRTKDDGSVDGVSLGYTDSTVLGVSFNISKGLAWIKN